MNGHRLACLLGAVIVGATFVGCASSPKSEHLMQLNLGMKKQEVTAVVGPPRAAHGAIQNKYGQTVEVWEYLFKLPSSDSAGQVVGKTAMTVLTLGFGASSFKAETRPYWLYFVDSRLVRWGEAGDWSTEPQRIYDVRFDTKVSTQEPAQ